MGIRDHINDNGIVYSVRNISKETVVLLNWGTPDIAEDAQKDVMGENHAYPMIAFGTYKKKSAFKLYARAKNLDFGTANDISGQIDKYEEALKYAGDDERDEINIYDYIDEQYHDYIKQSQAYWGIISDKKKAPCSFLLYSGDIREEIGLIKCKSESTRKEYITTVIDGAVAEDYKFLKNDKMIVVYHRNMVDYDALNCWEALKLIRQIGAKAETRYKMA